jgi:energy-converting hydrogenase Eha subunit E
MRQEDADHEHDELETETLFQRVCLFFLVYPDLLTILVITIIAVGGLLLSR